MKKLILLFSLLGMFATQVFCNNIQVGTVNIGAVNVGAQTVTIDFAVSWENSWRTTQYESNFDAGWLFVKGHLLADNPYNPWVHVRVAATGHTFTPTGYGTGEIVNPADHMGVFVQRDTNNLWPEAGNSPTFGGIITLTLDLAGTGFAESDGFDLCVEAIEMVYVPTGAFYVGHGNSYETNTGALCAGNNPLAAFRITSENALTLGGNNAANLAVQFYPNIDDFNGGPTQTLPATFPKGYNAFYCMKYEISQGQMAELFRKINLYLVIPLDSINTIDDHGVVGAPDRACTYIPFEWALMYSDWCGLRPMTELEYEKAARGTRTPLPDEFAWGSSEAYYSTLVVTNQGTPSEAISNVPVNPFDGFGNYSSVSSHLLRCGVFAASFYPPTRANAGASYYGIMEMSGNAAEPCVYIGSPSSRAFDGSHGDGDAFTHPTSWNNLTVMLRKGGSFLENITEMRISIRHSIFTKNIGDVLPNVGFRCVRTAP